MKKNIKLFMFLIIPHFIWITLHAQFIKPLSPLIRSVSPPKVERLLDKMKTYYSFQVEEVSIGFISSEGKLEDVPFNDLERLTTSSSVYTLYSGIDEYLLPYSLTVYEHQTKPEDWMNPPYIVFYTPEKKIAWDKEGKIIFDSPLTEEQTIQVYEEENENVEYGYMPFLLKFPTENDILNLKYKGIKIKEFKEGVFQIFSEQSEPLIIDTRNKKITEKIFLAEENTTITITEQYRSLPPYGYVLLRETRREEKRNSPAIFTTEKIYYNYVVHDPENNIKKQETEEILEIAPVPFEDNYRIVLRNNENILEVKVYDKTGTLIASHVGANSPYLKVDASEYPSESVLFIQVSSRTSSYSKLVIKK